MKVPAHAGEVLPVLASWVAAGWLRRLDAAFARFAADVCPAAPDAVLLAAALVAHLEGRGHICLDLQALATDADELLGWPPAGCDAFHRLSSRLAAATGQPGAALDWPAAMRDNALVWADAPGVPAPAAGVPPLVLRGTRLYLRRHWRDELRVATQLRQRAARPLAVDEAAAATALQRLFPTDAAGTAPAFDLQRLACALALRGHVTLVTGGPGTGKTHTAARLLALLASVDAPPGGLRVALAAPTGKAAARLKQAIDSAFAAMPAVARELPALRALATRPPAAQTLHALLGARPGTRRLRHHAAHPLALDVLVVDEASMVHLEMMAALLDALPPGARLVLLGDKDQLASVEAGAVLGELCRDAEQGRYDDATAAYAQALTGQPLPAELRGAGPALAQQTVMLRHSHRFDGDIARLAVAVNRGDAAAAAALLDAGTAQGGVLGAAVAASPSVVVALALEGRRGAPAGLAGAGGYLRLLAQRPPGAERAAFEDWARRLLAAFDGQRVLCALRDGEWGAVGLNSAIEAALRAGGRLPPALGGWYEGRPVLVTRNDPSLGVFNGDIGIALRPAADAAPLRVYFTDGAGLRSVAASRLAAVETAYAMTVHKSQGSEFGHAVLVLPPATGGVVTRELVYTGLTRARLAFTLISGSALALQAALAQRTRRAGGLHERLAAP